jgi:high-affinity Fe2+/Pb2+ permease
VLKQGTGISASLGAILSSVATISCCLPLGFAAALGAGAASAFFTTLRPWLLALSVGLLGLGFWQQQRAKQCAKQCSVRGRMIGNVLLWTALVVVLGMILFPQEIAAFIADRFSGR